MLQEARGDVASHPAYRRYHYAYGPLSVTDAAGTRFIGTDALGSPTDLTTTNGTVAAAHQYDAWGQYRNGTAPSAEEPKLGYTGHQFDPETGLVYARARYYDPEIGIFISRDTYEGELEDGPSLHRYAYAWANPLRYWDSTGLCTEGEDEGCEIGVFQAIGAAIESATSETTYAEARMKRMEANHQARIEELAEEAENGPGAIKRAKEAIGRGVGSAVEWWNGTWVGRKLNSADDRAREYAREKGAQAFEGLPTGDNVSQTAQLEELGMGAPEHYADKEELGADIAEYGYEQGRDAALTHGVGKAVGIAGGTRIVKQEVKAVAREEKAVAKAVASEERALVRLERKGGVVFSGKEVRGVRDLSHVDESTLREMARRGFAPVDRNGEKIVLHHLRQDPSGPLVEMPGVNHSIRNKVQHPRGNTPGAGLSIQQREEFNAWREEYWKSRAREELHKRSVSVE